MARIIVVTSGKGGVGKTTSSASFATGLALRGHKTAVIDFDVGLRNLDLIMGCERRVVYDLINVDQQGSDAEPGADQGQALRKPVHPAGLANPRQGRPDRRRRRARAERPGQDGLRIHHLRFAGRYRARRADGADLRRRSVIVTNPEVSSVRDSDRILGILQAKSRRAQSGGEPVKEHLLITRYSPRRVENDEMLSYQDVQEILRIPLIGIIPESEAVLHASNQGNPAIHFKETDVPRLTRTWSDASSAKRSRCATPAMKSRAAAAPLSEQSDMPCFLSCFPRNRKAPMRPRKGCRSSSRASAAAAAARTSCRPCTAN
jgi:septum site-determining protein MinD